MNYETLLKIFHFYFQEFHTRSHRLVICDLLFHKKLPQMVKNIMLAIMRPIHTQTQFVHKWIFMRLLLDKKIAYTCMFMFRKQEKVSKVHIFWEGHKILWNLHPTFVLCSASQNLYLVGSEIRPSFYKTHLLLSTQNVMLLNSMKLHYFVYFEQFFRIFKGVLLLRAIHFHIWPNLVSKKLCRLVNNNYKCDVYTKLCFIFFNWELHFFRHQYRLKLQYIMIFIPGNEERSLNLFILK